MKTDIWTIMSRMPNSDIESLRIWSFAASKFDSIVDAAERLKRLKGSYPHHSFKIVPQCKQTAE